MPNPDGSPTPPEQTVIDGLNMKIAATLAAFDVLNKAAGEERYAPSPDWDIRGAVMALSATLVQLGLVTDSELTINTAVRQVEELERQLTEARDDLVERNGGTAPLGWLTRPQG